MHLTNSIGNYLYRKYWVPIHIFFYENWTRGTSYLTIFQPVRLLRATCSVNTVGQGQIMEWAAKYASVKVRLRFQ